MNKKKKWVGISIGVLITIVIIAGVVILFSKNADFRAAEKTALNSAVIPTGVYETIAFVNVNVVPMDSERILEGQTVVVENERITSMGSGNEIEIPTDALVLDGKGQFLMPGLSDMHVHLLGSENDLLLYLANGVTTIRDMGDGPADYLDWRDEVIAGTRTGPNIWVWSPSIRELEGIEAIVLPLLPAAGIRHIKNQIDAEKLVTKFKDQGYDGIKVKFISSVDLYEAVLKSAANQGIRFDGHTPEELWYCDDKTICLCENKVTCWNKFLSMEVEAVAHLGELMRSIDTSAESITNAAQEVADDGIWISTTMILMRSITEQINDLEGELAKPEVSYVNPSHFLMEGWLPGDNEYAEFDPDFWVEYRKPRELMLLALNEADAQLLAGTDSPLPMVIPGFALHNELEYMVDVGFSPYDALRTSTYNPALYFNQLDEFGTIEVGKRADLVLLDGNPLEDITNTKNIDGVMARGRWFTREDLDVMLDAVANANEAIRNAGK